MKKSLVEGVFETFINTDENNTSESYDIVPSETTWDIQAMFYWFLKFYDVYINEKLTKEEEEKRNMISFYKNIN